MSSPAYELYFREVLFDDVADYISTFAEVRKSNSQTYWIYPRNVEHFDLVLEKDEAEWGEFIQDDIDVEFFLTYFHNKVPSCSLYVEGRKWAGPRGMKSVGEIALKLLTKYDGLFATEDQLFTRKDLEYAMKQTAQENKVIDYRAIRKTDDLLTQKRIALGIREVLRPHYWSDPYFEIGDDRIRKELTEELVGLGEAAIQVIAPWLESENVGLVSGGAEIIGHVGGEKAIEILKRIAFEGKVNSFAKDKAIYELRKLVSGG